MALIPVTKNTHAAKRLKPVTSLSILANVPHCEVLGTEFAQVSNNYPIFFVQRETQFIPLALFSLEPNLNLFIDENGYWDGLYLPAAFRRYPFTFGRISEDSEEQVLLVEEDMLSDEEGEGLFGNSDEEDQNGISLIGRVLQFNAEASRSGIQTAQVLTQIAETGIIVSAKEAMNIPEEQTFLPGFMAVSEQKFNELPDETILALRRSGGLALIYLHLASLGQLGRLQVRHNLRNGAKNEGAVHSPNAKV
jgi:hypothetical protein